MEPTGDDYRVKYQTLFFYQFWVWAHLYMPNGFKFHMVWIASDSICWAIWRAPATIHVLKKKTCSISNEIICSASSFLVFCASNLLRHQRMTLEWCCWLAALSWKLASLKRKRRLCPAPGVLPSCASGGLLLFLSVVSFYLVLISHYKKSKKNTNSDAKSRT